jgi:hypothetical protein
MGGLVDLAFGLAEWKQAISFLQFWAVSENYLAVWNSTFNAATPQAGTWPPFHLIPD